MKTLFRFIVLVLLVAGWGLAALSLHVVRAAGDRIVLIPKQKLGVTDTYGDARAVDHLAAVFGAHAGAKTNLTGSLHLADLVRVMHCVLGLSLYLCSLGYSCRSAGCVVGTPTVDVTLSNAWLPCASVARRV